MYSKGALLPAFSKCCTLLLRQFTFFLCCTLLLRQFTWGEVCNTSKPLVTVHLRCTLCNKCRSYTSNRELYFLFTNTIQIYTHTHIYIYIYIQEGCTGLFLKNVFVT